jgi:hypothetical protein
MHKIQTDKKLRTTALGNEAGTPAFPFAELPADPADPLDYIDLFLVDQILRQLGDGFFHLVSKLDPVPSLA